jgi:hypothetical protein
MVEFIVLECALLLTAIFRLSEISFLKKKQKPIPVFWNITPFFLPAVLSITFFFSEDTLNSLPLFPGRIVLLIVVVIQILLEIIFHIMYKPLRTIKSFKR